MQRLLSPRRAVAVAAGVCLALSPMAGATESSNDYNDADYAAFDADNMARTGQRQDYHLTTPGYHEASRETATATWLEGIGRQHRDADEGRVYAGVGQIVPGGNVGDPEAHWDGVRHEVEFLNREGTKLVGNVWPCAPFNERGDACPLVVVTTGSIQVTQHMYGWLARHLQDHGYTVFTFDVRGQGESETTNQSDPFGSNPQDGANFVNGTIDALRFALSTPDERYSVDSGADDHNPVPGAVDGNHIALVGHSLGASAVSTVQQCSTMSETPPDLCGGDTWPIRAVVAYDSLSAGSEGGPIVPVVPAFDHRADGYFINAVPSPQAPDPDARLGSGSPFDAWAGAGVDVMSITGRGFTHAEWSQIPFIVSATRYGVPQSRYYTLAWLDRYLHPDRSDAGYGALLGGPAPVEPDGSHADHRASLFSGRYRSGWRLTDPVSGQIDLDLDLRARVGVAPVQGWAALNAEREYGTATRGLVSGTAQN